MNRVYLLILSITLFVFSGCSTKEYYKPKDVSGTWEKKGSLNQSIIDVAQNGATLEDRKLIIKDIFSDYHVPENYRFINESNGYIICSDINGKTILHPMDKNLEDIEVDLKKTVATASLDRDMLAIVFASNATALYSLSQKKLIFKESGGDVIAIDTRMAQPYFFNDLVIFPTLDGKADIVNSKTLKLLRSITLGEQEYFDNVIYYKMLNDIMIVSTSYNILSFGTKEFRESYDIRDVIYNENGVWITTKQGEVIAMTPSLELIAKQKFPFAHFLGLLVDDDKVYAIEKEGYLIELDHDLKNFKVYDAPVGSGYVFTSDTVFFNDDNYINTEK
ncbi:MAG: hypothetical protein GQ570_09990 [Helicobacteraceae bacterium]|nr:hypothetical protein [Helicobacteraceae bacterium]